MANPTLQLRLTQKLALAPQLQQAIRLLQLNRIELRDYVQELVDANPLLDHEEHTDHKADSESRNEVSLDSDVSTAESGEQDSYSEDYDNERWEDSAGQEQWAETAGWSDEFSERQIEDTSTSTLRDHLLSQVALAHFSARDAAIAGAIIYALDDDGFLLDEIDDIRNSLLPELVVDDAEVTAVLRRVQRLEPVGVASRTPGECIIIQLRAQPTGTKG